VIPTLPPGARNRLAETILAALHDARARRELARLAEAPEAALAAGWLSGEERRFAGALTERARRAGAALTSLPLDEAPGPLAVALADAAALHDAGLYFEVHELLEGYWRDARGEAKEALQGLIQIAVGYQHLANGNLRGARALVEEGAARLRGRRLGGLELDLFAGAVAASLARLDDFDWTLVPRFPRAG
jgi:hypothetical protein